MAQAFCSSFDEALAHSGPAGVFLADREGRLRLDADRTRDAWERARGPHPHGWTWVLARDRATGFTNLLLVTSPTLMPSHPRADLLAFPDRESAAAALEAR
jgi:hypothetical protein